MMPAELLAPRPRDPRAAARLFAKNRSTVTAMFAGGAILPPVVLFCLWLKFGSIDALSIGFAFGLGAFVELFGVAMLVQMGRAKRLYRDGVAMLGRVEAVKVSSEPQGSAYVQARIAFLDGRIGEFTTVGRRAEVDLAEGMEVPVLYLASDPRRFAVYSPALGMIAGVVKS